MNRVGLLLLLLLAAMAVNAGADNPWREHEYNALSSGGGDAWFMWLSLLAGMAIPAAQKLFDFGCWKDAPWVMVPMLGLFCTLAIFMAIQVGMLLVLLAPFIAIWWLFFK